MPQAPQSGLTDNLPLPTRRGRGGLRLVLVGVAWVCAACCSLPPLPPADFSAPEWRVQQGQAVWQPPQDRPELAGELLFAARGADSFLVQFSKTPFSLATAQRVAWQWQIELGSGEFVRRGRGEPPGRFVWFLLPRALTTGQVELPWQFERKPGGAWRLWNSRTGESLEGYLAP